MTAPVKSDLSSPALPEEPLPMRGAILTALVNAFRLGDKVRTSPSGFSGATAKRILQDDPAVAIEKRTALTRSLVTYLFPIDYLRARGLDDGEAHIHDEMLVQAIEDVLDRWEAVARVCNHLTQPMPTVEMLFKVSGIELDVMTRVAAYLCRYPRLHPVLGSIGAWASKPGISGAFEDLVNRAGRISLERLCKASGLKKNTVKALRDGKVGEPQGETLEQLAHAFARHGVARRDEEGDATAAEIELELRVAAALGHVREAVETEERRASLGYSVMLLRHLRSELRRYTREELAGLVVRGRESSLWPSVEEMIRGYAFANAVQCSQAMEKTAAYQMQRFQNDPVAGMKWLAEDSDAQARYLREAKAALGDEGGELVQPLVDFFDYSADLMRRMADAFEGKEHAAPAPAPKHHLPAIEAFVKTMNAITPWDPPASAEKLRLLREAVAACPSFIPPRLMLADELAAHGRHDEALAHLHALVGEQPENPLPRYELALRLASVARYAEALAELEEVERRGGFGADAEGLRGECLLELGHAEEAEKAFGRALDRNERLVIALQGMARCRRIAGDEREARKFERDASYYGTTSGGPARTRIR